ncbi:MAG: leucine-rich repeat domain-containing protein [Clostridiales bacterium]|nr:leucine-rich repeat domain-containing protein [Clostridiales bacterium]
MKKKFGLWLNLLTICLCVCALAIGVYAAKQASLTATGTIGFKAHDCEVEVSMTKMGYSLGDGTIYQTTAVAVDMDSATDGTQTTGKVAGNGGTGTISTVDLEELNFTDLAAETIPNIVLTMTITNKSVYQIAATVTVIEADNVTYVREYNKGTTAAETKTAHSGAVILNASTVTPTDDESVTFTITLRVVNPEQDIESLANNLQITANLFKYDASALQATVNDDTQKIKYTLNTAKDSYIVGKNGTPTGEITIEPFINGLPVTTINSSSSGFASTSTITAINMPNTITSISPYAFYTTSGITSISLPDSVTTIGTNAFENSTSLANISFSNNLTNISFNNLFANCPLDYNIKDDLKYLGNANNQYLILFGASDLTKSTYNISPITKFIAPSAFSGCSNLSEITIPGSVNKIETSVFSGCTALKSVTICEGVKSIGYSAFSGCTALTNLSIPSSVISVGSSAFDNINSELFYTDSGINYLRYANNNDLILYSVTNKYSSTYTINANTKIIASSAFHSCSNLSAIILPDNLVTIDSQAFYGCSSLSSITLINSLTSIGSSAFYNCSKLATVYIDGSIAFATAVSNYSSNYIFKNTTDVYIQKDVDVSGYKFTKVDDTVYTVNDIEYLKYTETY